MMDVANPAFERDSPTARPLALRWAKSMRALFILASLIPSMVYAIGIENISFYAVFDNNKVIVIEFSSDGQIWNDKLPIYSNKKVKAFTYCWSDYIEHLYCSQTQSKLQAVVYRKGADTGGTYRQAMKVFKRNVKLSETGGLLHYYVCDKGCSSSSPLFIFKVGDSGC
jgi:hypothetical protein